MKPHYLTPLVFLIFCLSGLKANNVMEADEQVRLDENLVFIKQYFSAHPNEDSAPQKNAGVATIFSLKSVLDPQTGPEACKEMASAAQLIVVPLANLTEVQVQKGDRIALPKSNIVGFPFSLPETQISPLTLRGEVTLTFWICPDGDTANELFWLRSGGRIVPAQDGTRRAEFKRNMQFSAFEAGIGEINYISRSQMMIAIALKKGDPRVDKDRVGFVRSNVVVEIQTGDYSRKVETEEWETRGIGNSLIQLQKSLGLADLFLCAKLPGQQFTMKEAKPVSENGLSLQSSFTKNPAAGQPLWCRVVIANNSKETLGVDSVNYYRDLTIQVHHKNGDSVSLTRFGQANLGHEGQPKQSKLQSFSPGERFIRQFELSRLFDLTEAGTYLVSISKTFTTNDGTRQIGFDKFEICITDSDLRNQ